MIRAGTEEPRVTWYAEYWRQHWYHSFTGNSTLGKPIQTSPPDFLDCEQVWRRLAPQLDQLCIQADTVVDMCRQMPIPVVRLKAQQHQLKVDTLTMQQVARPSLAFGPLAMAFLRDTFSLEAATLGGMAEEHARAYHVFRARTADNYAQLEKMCSHDPRRALYACAIG